MKSHTHKTEVLHIILSEPSKAFHQCIDSGKEFAEQNGYTYTVLTDIPVDLREYRHLAAVSDVMRTRYAIDAENLLYLDWDVRLFPDFTLPTEPGIYAGDGHAIFYKTRGYEKFFREVLRQYETYPLDKRKKEYCKLWKYWKTIAPSYGLTSLRGYTHG